MDRRFYTNPFVHDYEEDPDPEQGPDSPSSGDDAKVNASEPKSVKKRVVSVPIASDAEGSKSKGEAYPPADSWAWRKYGQKPIKGSPYPRTADSKINLVVVVVMWLVDVVSRAIGIWGMNTLPLQGLPRQKASGAKPPGPHHPPRHLLLRPQPPPSSSSSSKNHHHHHHLLRAPAVSDSSTSASASAKDADDPIPAMFEPDELSGFIGGALLLDPEFDWLADVASTSSFLQRPVYEGGADAAPVHRLRDEEDGEDPLFADLGELPECSLVFRRTKSAEPEGESRRRGLTAVPCVGNVV
ncbi:hypothetical protein NL676_001059 [Syzygium grande]|nr:hypothetical protein NL676_001059 [Syzygium grande]